MALKSGRVGIHPSQVDPITGMLLNGPTPGDMSFEDLSDAEISSPEVGQTLQYNGTGWENVFASIAPTTLAALQDVDITDPQDGDYLVYDDENDKWVNSGSAPTPTYTDVTCTFYGAVEDIISFTDAAGVSHLATFAANASSKQETFKIDPSGSSITFSSGVAKNPDNLSESYSKTVTITSATTEVWVMPNNVLYWWGYVGDIEDLTTANGWSYTRTLVAPTRNKNDITIYAATGSLCGIATTSALQTSDKIIHIGQGVTASNNNYGGMAVSANKSLAFSGETTITTNTLQKTAYTLASNGYYHTYADGGRSNKLYALYKE